MPLRIFLSGAASTELDAIRRRLAVDDHVLLVDRIEQADAVLSLPVRTDTAALVARARNAELIEALTAREHEVLELAAEGLPNREIASALRISEHTVKFHLASVFGKLGVSTRAEAVRRGIRLGVIDI